MDSSVVYTCCFMLYIVILTNNLIIIVVYCFASLIKCQSTWMNLLLLLAISTANQGFLQKYTYRSLISFNKFSAPTIAFLALWLAKKLRLWANSRSFTPYGKWCAKFKNFPLEVFNFSPGNKNRRQNPVWEFTKTIIPFALVGYEVISPTRTTRSLVVLSLHIQLGLME